MHRSIPNCACALLASVSAFALGSAAWGQTKPSAVAAAAPASPDAELVVTGSRISQNGYQAPTPVTVAPVTELLKSSPTSIPDGLNKLPQFIGSTGPNKQANIFGAPNHGNILNLRGIGPTRTLILLDGVRAPPSTYLNTVDVDLFPTLLVQRVDIVTAGASSVYGSDAVSGVVNFILDSKFSGVKGMAQGGISTRGDGANMRFALAAGSDFAAGRGHFIASADFNQQDDYPDSARPKLNDLGLGVGSTGIGAAGSATNPLVQTPDMRASFATFGGLAVSGPFANTNFVSPGVYHPVVTGTATGTPSFFHSDGEYMAQGRYLSASAYTRNATGFAKATYDLSDQVTAYVQLMGSRSDLHSLSFSNLVFGGTALPIFSGNPFIPAPLQAQLTSTSTPSFKVSKLYDDLGPIRTNERINNYAVMAGLKGKIDRFSWRLDYAHGESEFRFRQSNQFELSKLAAALDAVVDPNTGATVCGPTLNASASVRAAYAGCAPFNTLGLNAASPAAAAYVMGTSMYTARNTTNDVVATISGDLFNLPAGPLSAAVGAEYRSASLDLDSNSDPGTPVDVTGLRGISASTVRFYLTNVAKAKGSQDVKEVFAELAAPLLRDLPLIERLDLNGAFRETDYSTSGSVQTWKVGGTWTLVDGVRVRAARSRDIRAPTLFDLFAGPQFTQAAALDPHTGVSSGFNQITSGNPNLKPETGDTFTAGVVLQPQALSGFSLSVDYYSVKIEGAITTLTPLAILQDCEVSAGTAPSCANIVRPLPFSDRTPANYPTQVTVSGINAALIETKGIDFDASYRRMVGPGMLTIRLYATYLDSFKTQLSAAQPIIDYAGYNAAGSGGVAAGLPKWKGNLSLNYDVGPLSLFAQENYISSLKFGPVLVYSNPHIPAFWTTDFTASYRLKAFGSDSQIFASVTNLFDATPPIVNPTSVPGAGLSTIVGLYDVTGRAFVVGTRFAF